MKNVSIKHLQLFEDRSDAACRVAIKNCRVALPKSRVRLGSSSLYMVFGII